MRYVYCFANISLTLRLIEYLSNQSRLGLKSLTIIYLIDRWVAEIKLDHILTPKLEGDFLAVLNENGAAYKPPHIVAEALQALEQGNSPTDIMNQFQIVIVSHGRPNPHELRNFRQHFVQGLGYCPQNLV